MPRGGAGPGSSSPDSGGDSTEVANAVSTQASISQENTSRMVRNKMPDFENQERGRKCKGELFVLIIPRSLSGSWVFCNQFGLRITKNEFHVVKSADCAEISCARPVLVTSSGRNEHARAFK